LRKTGAIDPFENNPISTETNNQYLPTIISDGSGGAIITWQDYRNGSDYDIYAQRINSSGEVQWTSNGVPVSTAANGQYSPIIINDGSGGAIITWYDYRNGSDYDIYAQKINSLGEVQWTSNGVRVSTAANEQSYPKITSDGSGGAIITWQDFRNGSNPDIYAQKVSSAGLAQWTANGVPVSIAANGQYSTKIINDGSGGAIITWYDFRNGSDYDIYAQKINSLGEVQWTNNGVPVSTAADNQLAPQITSDGSGGAIISWYGFRNGSDYDIYAKKVNSSGLVQLTANGVSISAAADNQVTPQITSDGSGGAIITWEDFRNGSNNDIYTQRINSSGEVQWTSNGVPVSTADDFQAAPKIITDGSGGAIITWQDFRNGSNPDIYAQKIDALGYLGIANPALSFVKDIKGDQGGEVSLNWNASTYDIPQQKVITYYSIWRGIDPTFAASLGEKIKPEKMSLDFSGKAYRTINSPSNTTFWEWIGNMPAHYLANYSFTANTISDSTASENPYFKFFVSAHTEDPFVFWDSNIDSGYSVDNLSPLSPQKLLAILLPDNNIKLTWSKNSIDPDVRNYMVYRSANSGFIPDETSLLSSLNDTIFIDTNVPSNIDSVYYKAETIDIHGNRSLPSEEASITLVRVEKDNDLPLEFGINQNYPNPFNPSTIISYQLAEHSKVILRVYNILGDEVAILVDQDQEAGKYEIEFQSAVGSLQLASGIYFYKLNAGNYTETKKMILLR